MSLSVRFKFSTKAEADAYVEPSRKYRAEAWKKGGNTGCISELACMGCHAIISDSVCLCVGAFTCPECGFENGMKISDRIFPVRTIIGLIFEDDPKIEYYI